MGRGCGREQKSKDLSGLFISFFCQLVSINFASWSAQKLEIVNRGGVFPHSAQLAFISIPFSFHRHCVDRCRLSPWFLVNSWFIWFFSVHFCLRFCPDFFLLVNSLTLNQSYIAFSLFVCWLYSHFSLLHHYDDPFFNCWSFCLAALCVIWIGLSFFWRSSFKFFLLAAVKQICQLRSCPWLLFSICSIIFAWTGHS